MSFAGVTKAIGGCFGYVSGTHIEIGMLYVAPRKSTGSVPKRWTSSSGLPFSCAAMNQKPPNGRLDGYSTHCKRLSAVRVWGGLQGCLQRRCRFAADLDTPTDKAYVSWVCGQWWTGWLTGAITRCSHCSTCGDGPPAGWGVVIKVAGAKRRDVALIGSGGLQG